MKDVTPNSKLMWKGEALCLSGKGACCQVQGPEFNPGTQTVEGKTDSPTSCHPLNTHRVKKQKTTKILKNHAEARVLLSVSALWSTAYKANILS